eukprot:TRINITY_DN36243_c0_g1_i1.p1 TRINITY_DN36243_c0_g1~~TRINITY_DN36243_c0_g1_i1.p1  ORF type:complete len:548 (+),score=80.64 TRINITY_DN36243_c0_g1_i1:113-1645(+)
MSKSVVEQSAEGSNIFASSAAITRYIIDRAREMALKALESSSPLFVSTMPGPMILCLGVILVSAQIVPMLYVFMGVLDCTEASGCLSTVTYLMDSDQTINDTGSSIACVQRPMDTLKITAGCLSQVLPNNNATWTALQNRLGNTTWNGLSIRLTKLALDPEKNPNGVWDASLFLSQVDIHRRIVWCFRPVKGSGQIGDPNVACVKEWLAKYQMEATHTFMHSEAEVVAFGIRSLYSIINLVDLLQKLADQCEQRWDGKYTCFTRETLTEDHGSVYDWFGIGLSDTTMPGSSWPARVAEADKFKVFHVIRLFLHGGNSKFDFKIDSSVQMGMSVPANSHSNRESRHFYIPEEYIWPKELDKYGQPEWYGPFARHPNSGNEHFAGEVVQGFVPNLACYSTHDRIPAAVPHDYNDVTLCDETRRNGYMRPMPAKCPALNVESAPATHMSGIFKCTKTTRKTWSQGLSEAQALGSFFFSITVVITSLAFAKCSRPQPTIEELAVIVEDLKRHLP